VLHVEHSFVLCRNLDISVDQKYQESFEMWYWRRMEKISWTDHLRNEEVLQEDRNNLQTIKRKKVNWIGYILHRNCLLIHIIAGKLVGRIEVAGRQGRRHNQLLDDLKEKRDDTGN